MEIHLQTYYCVQCVKLMNLPLPRSLERPCEEVNTDAGATYQVMTLDKLFNPLCPGSYLSKNGDNSSNMDIMVYLYYTRKDNTVCVCIMSICSHDGTTSILLSSTLRRTEPDPCP